MRIARRDWKRDAQRTSLAKLAAFVGVTALQRLDAPQGRADGRVGRSLAHQDEVGEQPWIHGRLHPDGLDQKFAAAVHALNPVALASGQRRRRLHFH